jgi:hypothetical protein
MKEIAGNGEASSTVKWGYGLKAVPDALGQVAAHYRRLANASVDDQPMSQALRERLHAAATRFEAAAASSGEWYRMIRNTPGTKEDFDAWENARDGSVHKEAKSDVRP